MDQLIRWSFWRSALITFGGLILFVLLMSFFQTPLPVKSMTSIILGILIALVPAIIWLVFFYIQDRHEPEPKRVIIRVFFFGALAASGAGLRLVNDFFRVGEWGQENPWIRLASLILIAGFTHECLKYAVVRYTVFPTEDFNDRVDGIIYGAIAGLGYATAMNVDYVISNEGVIFFVGSLRMVDTALAQAGFAAVTGYFMAGARNGDRPVWWVPAGLTIAATLNGVVAFLRREVAVQGLTYRPVNAFILSLVFITVTLAVLFAILRRAEFRGLSEGIRKGNDGK